MRYVTLSFLLALVVACKPAAKTETKLSATQGQVGPFVIPTSWTQASWYIDPANSVSGACASDNNRTCSVNNCSTPGDGPCLTYGSVASRWGTYSPRLRQVTTLSFLSSQTSDGDPVYINPYVENQAYLLIQGIASVTLTGTLSSVTVQNRSTPQLWQASLTGTGTAAAAGNLVIDSTAGAEFWTYALVTGTTWSFSEPLSPALTTPIPSWPGHIIAQKTISSGDAFTVVSFPTVNLVDVEPTQEYWNTTSYGGGVYIYNINVFSPGPGATQPLTIGSPVVMASSSSARVIGGGPHPHSTSNGAFSNQAYSQELYNTYTTAGIYSLGVNSDATNLYDGSFLIAGGILTGSALSRLGNASLAQDVILAAASHGIFTVNHGRVSQAYIASGQAIQTDGPVSVGVDNIGNGPQVWGPGAIDVWGGSFLAYSPPALSTFLIKGALTVDGATTACSYTNASPSVQNCGITVNAMNLDATAGVSGFGGTAIIPGGGAIRAVTNGVP